MTFLRLSVVGPKLELTNLAILAQQHLRGLPIFDIRPFCFEISIYTYDGEKPLAEIMNNITKKEKNGPTISHKEDNATLLAYFREILTDFDEDRVYPSDIKKILNWYNILQAKGLVSDELPKEEEETVEATEEAKN